MVSKWLTCSWQRSLEGRVCYVNVGLKGLDPKMRERGQEDTWSERQEDANTVHSSTLPPTTGKHQLSPLQLQPHLLHPKGNTKTDPARFQQRRIEVKAVEDHRSPTSKRQPCNLLVLISTADCLCYITVLQQHHTSHNMEQPKNTTDAKLAGAGTAAMVPEGTCHSTRIRARR